jgi:hypothetical protein
MESTDLNSPSSDDDRLRAIFREAAPALPDNGFSARVLTALPPRERAFMRHARVAVCGLGAVAGIVFAWSRAGSSESLQFAADRLRESLSHANGSVTDTRFLFAIAVTVLTLLYAFKPERRKSPGF